MIVGTRRTATLVIENSRVADPLVVGRSPIRTREGVDLLGVASMEGQAPRRRSSLVQIIPRLEGPNGKGICSIWNGRLQS